MGGVSIAGCRPWFGNQASNRQGVISGHQVGEAGVAGTGAGRGGLSREVEGANHRTALPAPAVTFVHWQLESGMPPCEFAFASPGYREG